VQRATSPDGAVDAVVVEVNGGATTAFVYEVYLVPKGNPPGPDSVAGFYRLSTQAGDRPLKLFTWRDRDHLEIRFDGATQGNLDHAFVLVAGRTIAITCIGTIGEPHKDNRCVPDPEQKIAGADDTAAIDPPA